MDRDSSPYAVELTAQAERTLANSAKWFTFLRRAIDSLADDPEPDRLTKFVAPADSVYAGSVIYEVSPFWIVYQLVGPNRVIVISITPQPWRMKEPSALVWLAQRQSAEPESAKRVPEAETNSQS